MSEQKSTLQTLASVDEDCIISYGAYLAGTGPLAEIVSLVDELEPAERRLLREIMDVKYRVDGDLDRRRAGLRKPRKPATADTPPPFDPPYESDSADSVAPAPNGLIRDAEAALNGTVRQ